MRLIDTHQHLIYRAAAGYGWTDGIPALAGRDFTLADYAALTDGAQIETVFMEAGADDADYRDEARFVARLIGGPLLGQIASCRPELDGFDDWLDECETLGVKGFRRILHVMPDDLSTTPMFRVNLRKIGARGMPFDLCVLARQHGIAERLLQACPDQPFVLDHCGVPDIAGDGFAAWATSLRRLAAYPHLTCKLSGITAYAAGRHALPDLRPYIDQVLDCFGAARMMWGSDWPVANLGAGLPTWLSQTHEILADLSQDEAAAIAHKTACRVYKV